MTKRIDPTTYTKKCKKCRTPIWKDGDDFCFKCRNN